MRVLLAAALLSMGAGSASAYSLRIDRSDSNGTVTSSDTVIVDVYLDAEPGLFAFSVGVLYDPTELSYNGPASQALPPNPLGPSQNTDGSQPAYILYAPAAGSLAAVWLFPFFTPHRLWGVPPPGLEQVNIDFLSIKGASAPRLYQSTPAAGTNIYIATLLFDVVSTGASRTAEIRLCNPGSDREAGELPECGDNFVAVSDPAIQGAPITYLLAEDITLVGTPITVSLGPPDIDGDGTPDSEDNCLLVPNGPLSGVPFNCSGMGPTPSQLDFDMDGYGNACDTDTVNDGGTGISDILGTLNAIQTNPSNLLYDFDCDGGAGVSDLIESLVDMRSAMQPGPSGLACAGLIPCP